MLLSDEHLSILHLPPTPKLRYFFPQLSSNVAPSCKMSTSFTWRCTRKSLGQLDWSRVVKRPLRMSVCLLTYYRVVSHSPFLSLALYIYIYICWSCLSELMRAQVLGTRGPPYHSLSGHGYSLRFHRVHNLHSVTATPSATTTFSASISSFIRYYETIRCTKYWLLNHPACWTGREGWVWYGVRQGRWGRRDRGGVRDV